jgi:hypothetical protein
MQLPVERVGPLVRASVGVCAVKPTRLCVFVLGVLFTLAGCNFHDGNNSSSASASVPSNLPSGTGSATLSWEAPTTTTQGAALTNLAGYRIYYGLYSNDLAATVQVNGVGLQTYLIDNLGQGTWYFAIKAVTSTGAESQLSNVVSKTIS